VTAPRSAGDGTVFCFGAYRVWLRMNSFVGGYPIPHFKQAKPISLSLEPSCVEILPLTPPERLTVAELCRNPPVNPPERLTVDVQ